MEGYFASIREYLPTVWRRWWALLVFSMADVLGLVLLAWRNVVMPTWLLVLLPMVGLAIAQFLAFHEVRKNRDTVLHEMRQQMTKQATLNRWHVRSHGHDIILENVEETIHNENTSFTGTVDGRERTGSLVKGQVGVASFKEWLSKCADELIKADVNAMNR